MNQAGFPDSPLRRLVRLQGGIEATAQALEIGRSTLNRWLAESGCTKFRDAKALAAIGGGKPEAYLADRKPRKSRAKG